VQREQDVRRYIDAVLEEPCSRDGAFRKVAGIALRKLVQIDSAEDLRDLTSPANQLETVNGLYSVRVNERYRISFRWKDGHPFDVEITDK
jgi:proteic killer suppression protein